MLFTIISVVLALVLLFVPGLSNTGQPINTTWIAIVGLAFLVLTPLIFVLSLIPLQKAQKNQTSFLIELLRKDHPLFFMLAALLAFGFISIISSVGFSFINKSLFLAIWIVLFGIAIDLLHLTLKRLSLYLDPFAVVQKISKEAKQSVVFDKDADLWQWTDALTEMATKAIYSRNISLSNRAVSELQGITNVFLTSYKSLSNDTTVVKTESLGNQDKLTYTLFYILDRFETINDSALRESLSPVIGHLVATLGKVVVSCAKFDMTTAPYPLHFLGKFALQAQDKGYNNVAIKAQITLFEVAKVILSEIDITYIELQPTFLSLISILENLAKNTFKNDKTISISLLIQPFRDLKETFLQEKYDSHQDTPAIIRDLDRIILEFETLETVLKTMPPISSLTGQPSSDGDTLSKA